MVSMKPRARGIPALSGSNSGGRRGVPRGRPVRSPDRAKKGDLLYAPLHSRMLYRNYIDQQISPCFLQDLQSEWEKEQMQKSYKGVKLGKRCEVVTVGRRAQRNGESRSHQIFLSPIKSGAERVTRTQFDFSSIL